MRAWGMTQGCMLCGERDETRDHLFFAYLYSFTMWHALANRLLGSQINPDWSITQHHLQSYRFSSLDSILTKLLFQTTIYHIWGERKC